jgi:glycosyltransferase involved in cell wall biosynthesis
MKILIIYNNNKYSGNYFTALRIKNYYNNSTIKNLDDNFDINDYDYIIAIHLIKCLDLLEKIKKPFSIIIAGTDCLYNQDYDIDRCKNILLKSNNIITFNKYMKERIIDIYNLQKLNYKIKIIYQSVDTKFIEEDIHFKNYFLWIGKLRKIKNPDLLISIANKFKYESFIIIGDYDDEYKYLKLPENVIYLNKLDRNKVLY